MWGPFSRREEFCGRGNPPNKKNGGTGDKKKKTVFFRGKPSFIFAQKKEKGIFLTKIRKFKKKRGPPSDSRFVEKKKNFGPQNLDLFFFRKTRGP